MLRPNFTACFTDKYKNIVHSIPNSVETLLADKRFKNWASRLDIDISGSVPERDEIVEYLSAH